MAVYLIDKRYYEIGLAMACKDKSARIVLMQDGVYMDPPEIKEGIEVYYLENDMKKRGVNSIPSGTKKLSYEDLVDLMEKEKIFNFI